MFLRRNVASQNFTLPGTLRAIADGSAVTSSATITILKDGTSAAGAGTLTHISAGAYRYTPTQSETDCQIMGFVLEATGAIALAGSIRTTNADPNDGTVLGLSTIGTINTAVGTISGNVSSILTAVDTEVAAILSAVDTEVASILSTVNTINTNVNTINTTTGSTNTTVGTINTNVNTANTNINILTTRLTAARADYLDNLSAGAVALAANLSTVSTNVSSILTAVDTEVASILVAVDTEIASIKAVTDKLDTAMVLDGAVYQFTTNALELAPTGGGGGGGASLAQIQGELDARSVTLARMDLISTINSNVNGITPTVNSISTTVGTINTNVNAIGVMVAKLDSMTQLVSGSTYRYTTSALQNAPAGGGGGSGNPEVYTGITLTDCIKVILAMLTGVSDGGGTSELVFYDIVAGVSKERVRMSIDGVHNRLLVTRDFTP